MDVALLQNELDNVVRCYFLQRSYSMLQSTILALLTIHCKGLSFTAIVRVTGASKSSVSVSLKKMNALGTIKAVQLNGKNVFTFSLAAAMYEERRRLIEDELYLYRRLAAYHLSKKCIGTEVDEDDSASMHTYEEVLLQLSKLQHQEL